MILTSRTSFAVVLLAAMTLVSCRGQLSDKPPVQPQQNMYFQERFNTQQQNPFFEDNRANRPPVEGTVARGQIRENHAFYEGLDADGDYVESIPVELSSELLFRGKDRYDIYCAVCHGGTGDGQGIIMTQQYGYVPAPTFHDDRIRDLSDGELYSAIYRGVRTMPSYATQINTEDRWAIVAYIRALQASQNATAELVRALGADPSQLMSEALAAAEDQQEAEPAEQPQGEVSAERGEQLFTRQGCQACHSTDGSGGVGPSMANIYGYDREIADGSTVTADEEYLHESIVDPGAKITAGYQNMMMPYSHLAEDEILSLIEFIKTLSDRQ